MIKNIVYLYNSSSRKTIIVGTGCVKRFNLNNGKIKNCILRRILAECLEKGEYERIDSIINYSKHVEARLKLHFEQAIKQATNVNFLRELEAEVKNLIETEDVGYLVEILPFIHIRIKD